MDKPSHRTHSTLGIEEQTGSARDILKRLGEEVGRLEAVVRLSNDSLIYPARYRTLSRRRTEYYRFLNLEVASR